MIKKLHDMGVRSEQAYWAGIASIGFAIFAWTASLRAGSRDLSRADRWGLFIGEWAPTFFAIGNGLRSYEAHEELAQSMESKARQITEPVG